MFMYETKALGLHHVPRSKDIKAKSPTAIRAAQLSVSDVSSSDVDRRRGSFGDDFDRPRKRKTFVDNTPDSQLSDLQLAPALWSTPNPLAVYDNRQSALAPNTRHIPSIPSLADLLKLYPCNLHRLQASATLPPTPSAHVPGAVDIATLLLLVRIAAPMSSTPAYPAPAWTNAAALPRPVAWHVDSMPRPLARAAAAAPPPMRWWAAAPGIDMAAAAAAVARLEAGLLVRPAGPARPGSAVRP